jgi:hypothetical protein
MRAPVLLRHASAVNSHYQLGKPNGSAWLWA